MSEIIEMVNAQHDAAAAERAEHSQTSKRKIHRRATKKTIVKAASALALTFGLWLAVTFDLVAFQLAIPVMAVALAYTTFWVGAWAQYHFGKGGFLDG